jgi:cation transport regulator
LRSEHYTALECRLFDPEQGGLQNPRHTSLLSQPSTIVMPYLTTDDLPESVRHHLPPHAQEIYLATFNSAWRQHAGDPDGEAMMHRIAWSAVKRRYRKAGDIWVPIRT